MLPVPRALPVRLTGLGRIARTLRNPNYGLYVAGNSVSLVGLWVQRVAVGWLAWELTHSATWLGIVSLADLAPTVLVGPFAGAFADRADRLRIMIVAQSLAMLQALALFVLTATGLVSVHALVALVAINGVVVGFNQPARLSLVTSLVPREDLSTAVAVNSIVFNLARFVGPAVAGLIIVATGVAAAFAVNALTFVAFLLALSRIRLEPRATPAAAGGASLARDTLEGVRYALGHAGIGTLLALVLTLSLGVRPVIELFPGFADAVFGRGAGALAALGSAVGIGAVAGSLWLAQRGDGPGLVVLSLGAAGLAAGGVAGFCATDRLALALPLAVVFGALLAVAGVGAQIRIQTAVDAGMRARVLSLYGLSVRAGPALGALVMGLFADRVGLRAPVAAGALLTGVVCYGIWRRRAAVAAALEAPPPRAGAR